MPNLIHLQKDLILKFLAEKESSTIEIDDGKGKVFLLEMRMEKDLIAIPFEFIIDIGIIKKKIKRDFTISYFDVENNVLSFLIRLKGSSVQRLENLIIQMINPIVNRFVKGKAPVKIEGNVIIIDLNEMLKKHLNTFTIELKEIAIFENEINILFN